MNNHIVKKLENILNSEWEFFGVENKKVLVDNEFICDLDNNFINILSDFYSVESISLLNKKSESFLKDEISLKKIANQHSILLKLKMFFRIELNKCLNTIKDNKLDIQSYYLDIPIFEDISSIWKFIISRLDDYDYVIEKLFAFSLISKCLKDPFYLKKYYRYRYKYRITYYFNSDFKIVEYIEEALKMIDEYIKEYEKLMFLGSKFSSCKLSLVNVKDFYVFDYFFNINNLTYYFYNEVNAANLEKYAFTKLNCYASMKIGSTNYMTFNGIENTCLQCNSNRDKLIKILKKLVSNLNYVTISNGVRYYNEDNEFITYQQFMDEKPEKYMNRMFTCCERKLLARYQELPKKETKDVELAITKSPCIFCKRAINSLNNDIEDDKIKIKTVKSQELENVPENLSIDKYDDFARKILVKIKN